jgi:hypothetical protein
MRLVKDGVVSSESLYFAHGDSALYLCGVRPVVYLSSDIWVDNSDSAKDGSTLQKAWNLK